jgi:hypothetical protein
VIDRTNHLCPATAAHHRLNDATHALRTHWKVIGAEHQDKPRGLRKTKRGPFRRNDTRGRWSACGAKPDTQDAKLSTIDDDVPRFPRRDAVQFVVSSGAADIGKPSRDVPRPRRRPRGCLFERRPASAAIACASKLLKLR